MINDNIKLIQEKINNICRKANRNPQDVKLMAVSKFHTREEILEAINCGITLFGENRVQEAVEKFPEILNNNKYSELHLIGQLQRNKVKTILPYVSTIQSVDRIELVKEIIKQTQKLSLTKKVNLFFEYHTGEDSKSGFTNTDDLYEAIETAAQSDLICCKGFMTMAPFTQDKKLIEKSFTMLRELSCKVKKDFPELPFSELSMGMSNDFDIAIEQGSTLVRIGTAIFGQRNYQ
jgi:pyridoxal phosphate enzyme (YggS family)